MSRLDCLFISVSKHLKAINQYCLPLTFIFVQKTLKSQESEI